MYPETLPLSLKVATLAPNNAGFSSILIPALFLGKKDFHSSSIRLNFI